LLLKLDAFPIDYINDPNEPELFESFTAYNYRLVVVGL